MTSAVVSATPYQDTLAGLRRKPTYMEVVDYIEHDPDRIKYPDRRAQILRNTFEMSQLDGIGLLESDKLDEYIRLNREKEYLYTLFAQKYNLDRNQVKAFTENLGLYPVPTPALIPATGPKGKGKGKGKGDESDEPPDGKGKGKRREDRPDERHPPHTPFPSSSDEEGLLGPPAPYKRKEDFGKGKVAVGIRPEALPKTIGDPTPAPSVPGVSGAASSIMGSVIGGAYYGMLMTGTAVGAGMAASAGVGVGLAAAGAAAAGQYMFGGGSSSGGGGRGRGRGRGTIGVTEIASASGGPATFAVDGSDVNQPATSSSSNRVIPRIQRDGASAGAATSAMAEWHQSYTAPSRGESFHSGTSGSSTPPPGIIINALTGGSAVNNLGESVYTSQGGETIHDESGVAFVSEGVYTAVKGVNPKKRIDSPVEGPEADHARELAEHASEQEALFQEAMDEAKRQSFASMLASRLANIRSGSEASSEHSLNLHQAIHGPQTFNIGTRTGSQRSGSQRSGSNTGGINTPARPLGSSGRNTPASQRSTFHGPSIPPPIHGMSTPPDG